MNHVMKKTDSFIELSANEMKEINGGTDVAGAAIAFVALCGAAIVGGFDAGRAFVRDLRKKFS